MKAPLSWIKDFVEFEIPVAELAHRLTLAGLEVEEIRFIGLPLPNEKVEGHTSRQHRIARNVTGLAWDPELVVVGAILEVLPHPNADRLVLCRIDDGNQEHTVLTGAPNLFPYKGEGPLKNVLKVAYALEGARLYDGHSAGWEIFTLKKAKIRGVESYSMACSEKELGISDEHEGVIILDEDAEVGLPLAEYMGDVVLDISLTPNIARNANILGIAREISALTGAALKEPNYEVPWSGPGIEGRVAIDIKNPDLNPRFVLGLVEGVKVGQSPYWVQRRLRLAGMRSINNIVDATNYAMLEIGEPLHAFDYDVLLERAGAEPPTIITRLPEPGEKLRTLDDIERQLDEFTVLVADAAGVLSIAGVMGGTDSEVSERTTNVLLEGASWNYINIRQTVAAQKLGSEASYRFERGVHPSMAERGVRKGLMRIAEWAGGSIAEGLVDAYPLAPETVQVEIKESDVERWLGVSLSAEDIAEILERLSFEVEVVNGTVRAIAPDHRMDIGEGIVGQADLMEEIARMYGYDRIPETMIADEIPPQYGNPRLEQEERLRDLLVGLGLQEVVTYRLTTAERETTLLTPGTLPDDRPFVTLENPITSDRVKMRHNLLASVLEIIERNARLRDRIAMFEIGPVFLADEASQLPKEPVRLAIVLCGRRTLASWQGQEETNLDFYDLKGIVEAVLRSIHLTAPRFEPTQHPSFHPAKTARVLLEGKHVGIVGELHPVVVERYDLSNRAVVAADLDLDMILVNIPERYSLKEVSPYPSALEDLAVVVDESVEAEIVESTIQVAGGELITEVRLFDLYRGDQVGPGKKSLAYSLIYQAMDRTLTDEDVASIRSKILKALEEQLGAKLRE